MTRFASADTVAEKLYSLLMRRRSEIKDVRGGGYVEKFIDTADTVQNIILVVWYLRGHQKRMTISSIIATIAAAIAPILRKIFKITFIVFGNRDFCLDCYLRFCRFGWSWLVTMHFRLRF